MKKILGLVLSLTLISGVCAAVLAYVNGLTEKPIAEMLVKKTLDAAKAVMPSSVVTVEKLQAADNRQPTPIFVGKDAAGKVVGYAVQGSDPKGYGGDIVLMVGFEADKKTVVAYRTLKAAETPGLGMKLNAPEFAGQFAGKDATALKVCKAGTPKPDEILAITSATITSKAVCRAVKDAAAKL